ncbi:3'(2'),5'-bisphosphate nucleotidase CysQ [candidate division KSB1 bacterium]|nr:3'(2'),5'-bisphosphate nucleotidase CysQ [candidate division KSB1 bacterium]
MEIYRSGNFDVQTKDDNSPLTRADKASHRLIKAGLYDLFPDIPLISEEGRDQPFEQRQSWSQFWLVDPLDGTKEFIKRNGEFTVNIALIQDRQPVFGIIYAPVWDMLYYGDKETGAFKARPGDNAIAIRVDTRESGLIAVKSRSHASAEEEAFFNPLDIADVISVGSSLKFCMVAEGRAQVYYRHGPTWEWDTAAGHAIVNAAGGLVAIPGGHPLQYNKEVIKNGSFYVMSKNYLPSA